jgi:hypothetical protein
MKLEVGMQITIEWNKCSTQENVRMEPNSFRNVVWKGIHAPYSFPYGTVPDPLLDTLHIVMRYSIKSNTVPVPYDIEKIRSGIGCGVITNACPCPRPIRNIAGQKKEKREEKKKKRRAAS